MKTKIIFEDNDILVCIKPAGFAVQSAKVSSGDMESELKSYLKRKTGNTYLGIVHRLDQPVRGVMVYAKNEKSAALLSKQVQSGVDKSMCKYYEALVYGDMTADKGTLTDYLIKDAKTNSSKVTNESDKRAKKAVLDYDVLERLTSEDGSAYCKLGIHLQTGRHHQIRVQFAHIGHPLLGDQKYGNERSASLSTALNIRNIELEAARLEFIHPSTGEKMIFDTKEY